ncbi:MAG: hypothetical protein II943_03770 [Victivallales bacterium]|nr:hypothetical protein [Victivallales bacterium]
MKPKFAAPLLAIIALLFSIQALFAEVPGVNTETSNARRLATLRTKNKRKVDEITDAILNMVKHQRLEWEDKYYVYVFGYNNATKKYIILRSYLRPEFYLGYITDTAGPGNNSQELSRGDSLDGDKYVQPFKIDTITIIGYITEKYGQGKSMATRLAEASGPFPIIDIRSKIELQEDAIKLVDAQFNRSEEDMLEEEIRLVEEEYPLYKENEIVEISFAPREGVARRTYRGSFKKIGRFKLTIGKDFLSMDELPEKIRARFDPDLNRIARERMLARHPIITRYKLDREDAIAAKVNEWLLSQFEQNLPRGWVYVNNAWKLPEDMVEDVIEYRLSMGWFYVQKPTSTVPPVQDLLTYLKEIGKVPTIEQK